MARKPNQCWDLRVVPRILEIRERRVILDSDLAKIYGVPTFRFNEAVKRNRNRFPADFMFRLTPREFQFLTSQNAMSKTGRGGRRTLPYAFTEHGAVMAANVLRSPRAVQMSVFVVRAFVRMRAALADTRDLAAKLAALEKELKERLDVQEAAIVDILQRIMDVIDPPALPEPPPKKIGFAVKEQRAVYSP
ncbi:MAG: ORF6N domain-containing protein [Kiritimatiellae bacterium]|nr:ORF6N domain-containing protein [Kiritimatiellia bacterium]